MEKRNYLKPTINTISPILPFAIEFTTTSSRKAVNMIESCFEAEYGNSQTISDAPLETYLKTGAQIVLKADNKGEANNVSASTCREYFTDRSCYTITYNGTTWKFTLNSGGCTNTNKDLSKLYDTSGNPLNN